MSPIQLAQFLIMSAFWGASYIFLYIATPEFGVMPLLTIRTGFALLFLLPFILIKNRQAELFEHWRPLLIFAVTGAVIPFSLISYSMLHATSGYASLMSATTAIFSAIIGYFWLKESITRLAIFGIIIAFAGIFVLTQDKQSVSQTAGLMPVFAVSVAAISYAFSGHFSKLYLSGISKTVVTGGTQLYATLITLPFSIVLLPDVLPSVDAWLSVFVLGVVCTGWAFFTFFKLIDEVGVSKTISSTYLIPVFGILWGCLFLDEKITFHIVVGIVTILSGVALTTGLIKFKNKK